MHLTRIKKCGELEQLHICLAAMTWCFFKNPSVNYIYGNTSHVITTFVDMVAKRSVYVLVEPSHTSMLLKKADASINRFIKNKYGHEYTAAMCVSCATGSSLNLTILSACPVSCAPQPKRDRTNFQLLRKCIPAKRLH